MYLPNPGDWIQLPDGSGVKTEKRLTNRSTGEVVVIDWHGNKWDPAQLDPWVDPERIPDELIGQLTDFVRQLSMGDYEYLQEVMSCISKEWGKQFYATLNYQLKRKLHEMRIRGIAA